MTNYAKVKEHKGLIRELHSKAILNTDVKSLQEHRKNKAMMKEFVDNTQKINKLQDDISEIKNILTAMIQNKVS